MVALEALYFQNKATYLKSETPAELRDCLILTKLDLGRSPQRLRIRRYKTVPRKIGTENVFLRPILAAFPHQKY